VVLEEPSAHIGVIPLSISSRSSNSAQSEASSSDCGSCSIASACARSIRWRPDAPPRLATARRALTPERPASIRAIATTPSFRRDRNREHDELTSRTLPTTRAAGLLQEFHRGILCNPSDGGALEELGSMPGVPSSHAPEIRN
jgi:hypothetical protein